MADDEVVTRAESMQILSEAARGGPPTARVAALRLLEHLRDEDRAALEREFEQLLPER